MKTDETSPPVEVAGDVIEAKPAAWMFVTATSKHLHYFPAGRGRSACGRYFRNPEFNECGLWWPEAGKTRDDCWTCRDRLNAATARKGSVV